MTNWQNELQKIRPLDAAITEEAKELWDSRTHPIGSLGLCEELTIQLCGIREELVKSAHPRGIAVMCADNGVIEEDVSSSPQIFTYLLANAMASGQTGVSTLAAFQDTEVFVVNIGILPAGDYHPNVYQRVVREGTRNFAKEPALTREEVIEAIGVGFDLAKSCAEKGFVMLGTGELGIANTTTSSAVLAALTGWNVADCVGLGAGITSRQMENKVRVIREALDFHKPNPEDAIDVLAKVGGLDLAGLTGVFLGCAVYRMGAVIDGIISTVAAIAATRIASGVKDFLFASHLSEEAAAKNSLAYLGLEPLARLHMRLGEGSGCPFTFTILDHSLYSLWNMGTLQSTDIQNTLLVNIRDKGEDQ